MLEFNNQEQRRKGQKNVIECKEVDNVFKIGHHVVESETFIPNVHFDKRTGITFTDIAGQVDSNTY